jgi:protein disulfide-isomerase
MKKLFASLLVLAAFGANAADDKKIYNESADPRADIQSALKSAKAENKLALIVFGANWCGDCKMLDMEMHQGDLAKLVNDKLVVVKVDVGRYDKNTAVADQYGNTLKKGIPTIALVRADGTVAYQTNGGELADARKMGREGVTQFFNTMLDKAKK